MKTRLLLLVAGIAIVASACFPATNPITDIPANHPDRGGNALCEKEKLPNRYGAPIIKFYRPSTGVRYSTLFGCQTDWDDTKYQGYPGRSPYFDG
jgi:hypothetical protein